MSLGIVFHCTGRGTEALGEQMGHGPMSPGQVGAGAPSCLGLMTPLCPLTHKHMRSHTPLCVGWGWADGPCPAICSGPGTSLGVCAIVPVAERETRLWLQESPLPPQRGSRSPYPAGDKQGPTLSLRPGTCAQRGRGAPALCSHSWAGHVPERSETQPRLASAQTVSVRWGSAGLERLWGVGGLRGPGAG